MVPPPGGRERQSCCACDTVVIPSRLGEACFLKKPGALSAVFQVLAKNEIECPEAVGALRCPSRQDSGDWADETRKQFGCLAKRVWRKFHVAWSGLRLQCARFLPCSELRQAGKELVPSGEKSLTVLWRVKRRGENDEQLFRIFRFGCGPLDNNACHGAEKSGEMPFDGPKGLALPFLAFEIDP